MVAPVWDDSAGALLPLLVRRGIAVTTLVASGFRLDAGQLPRHEDFVQHSLHELDLLITTGLCGAREAEMLSWRLLVLERAELQGARFLPTARGLRACLGPLGALAALDGAGIPCMDHHVSENLEAALDVVEAWKGAIIRHPSPLRQEMEWLLPGPDARLRLISLWQQWPEGPFVLLRHEEAPWVALCLGGDQLMGCWMPAGLATGAPPEASQATQEEEALARRCLDHLELGLGVVDLLRTPSGPRVFQVRATGFWREWLLAGMDQPARCTTFLLESARASRSSWKAMRS